MRDMRRGRIKATQKNTETLDHGDLSPGRICCFEVFQRVNHFHRARDHRVVLHALIVVIHLLEHAVDFKALRFEIHSVLKQVDYDYQRMQYNTVVSGAMKMINALEDFKATDSAGAEVAMIEGFGILLRCLYPATPHITHCLWSGLGYAQALGDLLDSPWPKVDPAALQQDELELMLQINGKLRGAIVVSALASKTEIEHAALTSAVFQKHAAGLKPRKIIVVPG